MISAGALTPDGGPPALDAGASPDSLTRKDRAALRPPWRQPLAVIGMVTIALWALIAIFAPELAPFSPDNQFAPLLAAPSHLYLFGTDELALMKPTAVLINTSRGPIVDEGALINALTNRIIAAAGLDVYDREPLPAGHELTKLDNVVLLPHLGYVSESGLREMYGQVVADIAAYLDGSPIRTLS